MGRPRTLLIVLAGGALAACATTLRYRTQDLPPIAGAAASGLIVVVAVDRAPNGLEAAVRDHLVRAGFATAASQVLEGPTTPEALEHLLLEAATRGAPAVVLLRVRLAQSAGTMKWWAYPSPVVRSLPIFRESATAAVEAWVVDPATREVLARPLRLASQQKRVNGWHYAPEDLRNEQLRHAVQAVLEDVLSARRAGYPARDAEVDLASALFNAPAIRQEGRRVFAPGISFELPQGFRLVPLPDPSAVMAEAPGGLSIRLSRHATFQGVEDFGDLERDQLSSEPVTDEPSALGDRPAHTFESLEDEARVITRVTTLGGFGLVLACAGPQEAKLRAELCDDLFDSVEIDPLTTTEP